MKVLFFCQDTAILEPLLLSLRLRWPELRPLIAPEGNTGLQVLEQEAPDLVVVCQDLPDLGMFAVIKEIRRFSDVPLIVAVEGQHQGEMELVKALELGADDYIHLPCHLMEIMVRAMAVLRRVGLAKRQGEEGPIRCGDLMIDPAAYEVFLGSSRVALTPTEFKLLYVLAKNRHTTISHDFIRQFIWSDEAEAAMGLKKYVQRLRRKLGDDAQNPMWIKTVRGVGYRFTSPSVPSVAV